MPKASLNKAHTSEEAGFALDPLAGTSAGMLACMVVVETRGTAI
jgi:hypothetical protein